MELRESIENYQPFDNDEEEIKSRIIRNMDIYPDVLTRDNDKCHFASSALVLNKERSKALVVYHNVYRSWLTPGGHADGDSDLLHVALKEVEEETGQKATVLDDNIFQLSISPIVGHMKRGKFVKPHEHMDAFYLLEADDSLPLTYIPDESQGVKWIPIEGLLDEDNTVSFMHPVHKRMVKKLIRDGYIKK